MVKPRHSVCRKLIATAFLAAVAGASISVTPAQAAEPEISSYGAAATVTVAGLTVQIPESPQATIGLSPRSIGAISLGALGSIDAVKTTAERDAKTGETSSSAETARANLGIAELLTVDADLIKSSCTAAPKTETTGTTQLADVVIKLLDVPIVTIPANPAPNTVLPLALPLFKHNLAELILNEQLPTPGGGLTVNGLRLKLLADPLGSGDIVISSATCESAAAQPAAPVVNPPAKPKPPAGPGPAASKPGSTDPGPNDPGLNNSGGGPAANANTGTSRPGQPAAGSDPGQAGSGTAPNRDVGPAQHGGGWSASETNGKTGGQSLPATGLPGARWVLVGLLFLGLGWALWLVGRHGLGTDRRAARSEKRAKL